LQAARRGDHDIRDAGAAGELTGAARAWQFGDEQPLDVVRTVGNALRRQPPGAQPARRQADGTGGVRLAVEDFEVQETERRTSAAVCLLVDLSYSMVLNGTWGAAKQTALALETLVATQFPQDALQVVGFSNYARPLRPHEVATLDSDMVQGTNLQHALMVAGRFLDRHPEAEPVVLVVTDGEPTAHLLRDGRAEFDWPPSHETLELTLAEVDRMTRRGATLNVFMLGDEPRLQEFVQEVARRNGGRVFSPDAERLGEYVVSDFLRTRRSARGR
ncbi:MAG: vWA domain-containing protein, partial [Actinomycetes bacterium]